MNQQPDKFFREKLDSLQQAVPPRAWDRISENLIEKKFRAFRIKIAAAVLVLATASILLYPVLSTNSVELATENAHPVQTEKPAVAQGKSPEAQLNERKDGSEKKPTLAHDDKKIRMKAERKRPVASTGDHRHGITIADEKHASPDVTSVEPQSAPTPETNAGSHDHESFESSPEITNAQAKRVTIVFTAEEVNEKYLTKKTEAEATSGNKETSKLQKLLDKAYDLKYNSDPLGELRQKKNEILAMNFRTENQQRTQND